MNHLIDSSRLRRAVGSAMLLLVVVVFAGCQTGQYVEGFDNGREKMELDAYDVVLTMRQAGFEDDQIIEHGPALRNAMAVKGGARIRGGQFTQAIFMVQDGEIYAVSQRHGSFRYLPEVAAFEEMSDTSEATLELP